MTLAESINAFAAEMAKNGSRPGHALGVSIGAINSIMRRAGESRFDVATRNHARNMLANAIADLIEKGDE